MRSVDVSPCDLEMGTWYVSVDWPMRSSSRASGQSTDAEALVCVLCVVCCVLYVCVCVCVSCDCTYTLKLSFPGIRPRLVVQLFDSISTYIVVISCDGDVHKTVRDLCDVRCDLKNKNEEQEPVD